MKTIVFGNSDYRPDTPDIAEVEVEHSREPPSMENIVKPEESESQPTEELPAGNVKDKLEALQKMALSPTARTSSSQAIELEKLQSPKAVVAVPEKSDSDCFWDKLKTEVSKDKMYVGEVDFRKDLYF